jgi:oxygen-independent coproporphyrinogen III oxidase
MDLKTLVPKYGKPGPRYTSYPTAPQWTDSLKQPDYRSTLEAARKREGEDLALYLHVPFCESLCYYCGCNIQITRNHERSEPYLAAMKREIASVGTALGRNRPLTQVSWGGGTPTFLTPSEITELYESIREHFPIAAGAEIAIEVDPRVTTDEHLERLRSLGFNRISLGVQDFDPKVQHAVNRVQSPESTERMLTRCRSLGFTGINFDFIYGLPFQTEASFHSTVDEIIRIKPDRIALYNYAHLPSLRAHQKILEKFAMPSADERLNIFLSAYDRLLDAGYRAIGMDHFALEKDELYRAIEQGSLYRNFMGYTVQRAQDMVGIGASAIGEFREGYFQNIREAKPYEDSVSGSGLATFRGCSLSDDDRKRKWIIQQIMCRFQLTPDSYRAEFGGDLNFDFADELSELGDFAHDGILEQSESGVKITPLGRLFVRNVAMVFDAYLRTPKKGSATYSQTL